MQTDPNNTGDDLIVDGGTPTDEEARLGAQIDSIGDNPQAEPTEAAPTQTDNSGDPPPPPDDQPATPPQPQPRAQPVQAEAPQPPRDFEAAFKDAHDKFESGEWDAEKYQTELRSITREEAAFAARLEIYNERQQTAAQQAESDFAIAALQWEQANADFMANPLRAKAMQDAILEVDKLTPGLAPTELLAEAQKVAFEAYGYTPPTDTTAADEAKRKAAAIAAAKRERQPAKVPTNLGSAPTAAQVDTPTNSAFGNLDVMSINDLENQIARMTPAQREEYLRDAPGAKATGHE